MMKRIKNTAYLIVFLLPLFLLACGEDEPELSREELLIGSWKLQAQNIASVTYQGTEFPESQFGFIEDLIENQSGIDIEIPEKIFSDSTALTFNADKSYTIYDPQVDETFPGSWSFNSNADTVSLTLSEEVTILPLNNNQVNAVIENLTENVLTLLLVVEDLELQGYEVGGKIRLNFNKE